MEMQKRPQVQMQSHKFSCRDKIEMAWRHYSKTEKILVKIIGFLVFALLCFIIAVIAMNYGFKNRIQELEDEIHDLKTTQGVETTTIDDLNTTLVDISTTMSSEVITTDLPLSTTEAPANVTVPPTTTATTTTDVSTGDTTTEDASSTAAEVIADSLRSLLTHFKQSTKTIDKTTKRGGYTTRSRGTFIILADINHEATESETPEADPSPDPSPDPLVYIDGNETTTAPEEDGASSSLAPETMDDTEDDLETTTEMDDLVEGSGD